MQRRGAVFAIISQVDDFTQLLASECVCKRGGYVREGLWVCALKCSSHFDCVCLLGMPQRTNSLINCISRFHNERRLPTLAVPLFQPQNTYPSPSLSVAAFLTWSAVTKHRLKDRRCNAILVFYACLSIRARAAPRHLLKRSMKSQ